jgi:tetratricopeptide (TPR) repeat protein
VGSKLAAVAALIVATTGVAAADSAADLFKQGVERYKANDYEGARAKLQKSYDLDPKPETLFALAQAQRNLGDCATAAPNYKKVIQQMPDLNVTKIVEQNLLLCEKDEPKPEPKVEQPPKPEPKAEPQEPAKPQIITKTVVHEVNHKDPLALALVGVGTLSLGVALGLDLASGANQDAAANAHSIADHDSYADRADLEQKAAVTAAIVGVALVGYGAYRWVRGSHETPASTTDVAVVPVPSGGGVWVRTRF